jgi:hypothetical protein
MVYVYVKFREEIPGFSYQPGIWNTMFHRGSSHDSTFRVLLRMVKYSWLSEYPNSLNLGLNLDEAYPSVIRRIQRLFPGGAEGLTIVREFTPLPNVTPWPEEICRSDVQKVLQFKLAGIIPFAA